MNFTENHLNSSRVLLREMKQPHFIGINMTKAQLWPSRHCLKEQSNSGICLITA
jgi:hypothetical protein